METVLIVGISAAALLILILIVSCLKKCPSDKIMVVFGRVKADKNGNRRSCVCYHGGAVFVIPLIQRYQFLDLNPVLVSVELFKEPLMDWESLNCSATVSVAVSVDPELTYAAAERLLGLKTEEIQEIAKNIFTKNFRLAFQERIYEQIVEDKDSIIDEICRNSEKELNLFGLVTVNFCLDKMYR